MLVNFRNDYIFSKTRLSEATRIKCCFTDNALNSAMDTDNPNLYDAIGVGADASADEIRKTTRKLMTDVRESDNRNSEKNELIRFFKSARETLMDNRAREEYDRSIGIETINDMASVVPFEPLQHFQTLHPFPTSSSRALASATHPSIMGILGSEIQQMFSNNSIVPEELSGRSRSGGLVPGNFHILEYTKVKNADGGFDEFGFTREGDIQNDRVAEKRFERKT